MTPESVVEIGQYAIRTAIFVAGPMLVAGMVVGLAISIFRDQSTRTRFSFASATSLLGLQLGQLHADTVQMQPGHLLIQVFWQHVHFVFILVGVVPQFDLSQGLVRE